jgi:hypothetical protein
MPADNQVYLGDVVQVTLLAVNPDGTPADLSAYGLVEVVLGLATGGGTYAEEFRLAPQAAGSDGVCVIVTGPGQLNPQGFWAAQIVGSTGGVPLQHFDPFEFEVLGVVG